MKTILDIKSRTFVYNYCQYGFNYDDNDLQSFEEKDPREGKWWEYCKTEPKLKSILLALEKVKEFI